MLSFYGWRAVYCTVHYAAESLSSTDCTQVCRDAKNMLQQREKVRVTSTP